MNKNLKIIFALGLITIFLGIINIIYILFFK